MIREHNRTKYIDGVLHKVFAPKIKDDKLAAHCHHRTTLDVYMSCRSDCTYCYSCYLVSKYGEYLWDPEDISVDIDIDKTLAEIPKRLKRGDYLRLGSNTDSCQPIEEMLGYTYRIIQVCNKHGIHYIIPTKFPLIATKKYMDVMDKELAHIQMSISHFDNAWTKEIEPGAPRPYDRLKALGTLIANGFDASLRNSPYFPELMSEPVDEKLYGTMDDGRPKTSWDVLAEQTHIKKIIVKFLRIPNLNPKIVDAILSQKKATDSVKVDGVEIELSEFTKSVVTRWRPIYKLIKLHNSNGLDRYSCSDGPYLNLDIKEKSDLLFKFPDGPEISVCDFIKDHYDCWAGIDKGWNGPVNPNPCDCCNIMKPRIKKFGLKKMFRKV